jgi:hypothetical protein
MASCNSIRARRGDTKNYVRWCSWVSLLRLLNGLHVHRCSWLFADSCRRSCHDSCQALSNDTMGRFEPSATGLSLLVLAFCVLRLRVRCLYLRPVFYLNMLALLHRYCIRGYGIWGLLLLYCCRLLAKLYHILDVVCFIANHL